MPKSAKNSLSIRLTESVVFLQGSAESTVMGRRSTRESRPAMLRGLLTLVLDKPTKISSIEMTLEGKSQTTWPEGMGARSLELTEEHEIFSTTTVFFRAGKVQATSARRTASVGPGLTLDREEDIEDDSVSNDGAHQHQQVGAPSSGPYLNGSRRRVSMDHHYLHLSRGPNPSLDSLPTPPYSPPFDSVRSSRVLEDHATVDQLGPHADHPTFSNLSREISEPQSASSSGHSHSLIHIPLSRRESVEESVPQASAPAYERSPSRGRPRIIPTGYSNANASPSRASSAVRTPTTAPNSPSQIAQAISPIPLSSPSTGNSNSNNGSILSHQPHLPQQDDRTTSRERGRRHARFSLAMVSNVLLDAVKERVRSNSPRSRPGKERAAVPASRDRSPDGSRVTSRAGSRLREPSVEPVAERGRPSARGEDGLKHKEKERSTLGRISGALGLDVDGSNGEGDGWKEFRKGTYTYPISFAIPADSPPSLVCEFGSVSYRLKATVHRPGTFTHRLTATRDVTLIASPGEDDVDESDNIVVQREWDSQMHYMIVVSGKAFPIGSTIPIHVSFMPLAKIKIFRISVLLEEKVEYFTQFKRAGTRAESARRFELLSLRYPEREGPPVLPLTSDYTNSPLHGLVDAPDESEAASSLMGPGPWSFQASLQLPKSCSDMHFTNKHKRSNIAISHILKIIFRVERGDDTFLDAKTGQRKHFDIVVQTPIHVLSCRCNPEWTALPRYSCLGLDTHSKTHSCPCIHTRPGSSTTSSPGPSSASHHSSPFHSLFHHNSDPHMHNSHTGDASPGARGPPGGVYLPGEPLSRLPSDTPSEIGSLFARLMAGEESELGEAPPQYEYIEPLENSHGALASASVVTAHR
ncbi:hypothetical protein DFH11DRAFT_1588801 [Phellopilus nigrolimitatus]|nr:hypothetical protein DFH11DRAFT_1588801 [Phellopilus nigrolimitatus]